MSRTISAVVAVCCLAGTTVSAQTLIWSDEFNTLNTNVWQPMIGDGSQFGIPGWGNNEWQYYTGRPENVRVENGELIIEARRENFGGKQYTSARLRTIDQVDIQYGRIEARIKTPATQGIWPAFWMLPTGSPYGGWPMSGEIDVMEMVDAGTTHHGTIHFGNAWPNNASQSRVIGIWDLPGGDASFADDYHVYRVDWHPDRFDWFVDGQLFGSVAQNQWFTPAAPSNEMAPFDNPFHMLLNVAVGGNWPGNPDLGTFPQQMRVDWVRVYSLFGDQVPYSGSPAPVPGVIEAEDFDIGGQFVSYNDSDSTNNGNTYRRLEAVDIEPRTGGGFNVGWLREGEWIEYTIENTRSSATEFEITAEVASPNQFGAFALEFDNGSETAQVAFTVPTTGGWQNWATTSRSVELSPGEHVMRLVYLGDDSKAFNIDRLTFDAPSDCPADLADSSGFGPPDGQVNFGDFFALSFLSGPCGSGTPNLACLGDLADSSGFGPPDGQVDFGDFFAMSFASGPCP